MGEQLSSNYAIVEEEMTRGKVIHSPVLTMYKPQEPQELQDLQSQHGTMLTESIYDVQSFRLL